MLMQLTKYKFEDFIDLKELGRGSFGVVRLLYIKKNKKHVVGKYFPVGGDEKSIRRALANAEKEAEILARIEHKNIVLILGIVSDEKRFEIILEHVSCGNLENLLLDNIDVDLPWIIRSRFFVDFASALNYLHYHDPKRSFIHGDLKPQNILLNDALQIKLADFGAAEIARATGTTSATITGEGNTQHTPLYTAPEFLKNPCRKRDCKMDVYSYGMIGYEILTRKSVFSDSQVSMDALIYLIKTVGQKPNQDCLQEVFKGLKRNSTESKIFNKLKEIVKGCWNFKHEERPKVSAVKKNLDRLNRSEKIVDKRINIEARKLIDQRNLKSTLPSFKETTTFDKLKQHVQEEINEFFQQYQTLLALACLIFIIIAFMMAHNHHVYSEVGGTFLLIDGRGLEKYDLGDGNLSHLTFFPFSHQETTTIENIVKVSDMVYVISCLEKKPALRVNISDSSFTWKIINWPYLYKNRKIIAFKDSIFAIGTQNDYMDYDCDHPMTGSAAAYMYNTTTNNWTQLPNMKEKRLGHTLVVFEGLICAIGGSAVPTAECYNQTRKKWSYLPAMSQTRRDAAAVEMNSELYVIGGTIAFDFENVRLEETKQHYSRYALSLVEKYNLTSNSWTKVASLREARMFHTAGVYNDKIVVLGGYSSIVEAYFPKENKWEYRPAKTVFNAQRYTRIIAIDDEH